MKVLGLVLLLYAVLADAQVYKWVDTQGQTNYSNVSPPFHAQLVKGEINVVSSRPEIMGMSVQNAANALVLFRLEKDWLPGEVQSVRVVEVNYFYHSIGRNREFGKSPKTLQPGPDRSDRRDRGLESGVQRR